MTVKAKRITAAAAAGTVFAVSVVLSVLMLRRSPGQLVEIVQDGTVIRTVDLANAPDETFRIKSADGESYNIICIRDGTICVSEAGCPDKICVRSGKLRSESLPVVCLPNRLVIRFAEGEAS